MTPAGIKLGRQFDARTFRIAALAGDVTSIVPGDSNRVAVAVAIGPGMLVSADEVIMIGWQDGVEFTPVTTLTIGSPKCFLSVDAIGSLVMRELFVNNRGSNDGFVGVTIVRQVQELP